MNIFHNLNEEDLVPGIEEHKNPTPEPQYKLPVHITPDEDESVRSDEKLKSSDFTYHKKEDYNTDTSAYGRVLNSLKKLDTSYNPTLPRMHKLVINGKYEVTGYTRLILIVVEHEEEEI